MYGITRPWDCSVELISDGYTTDTSYSYPDYDHAGKPYLLFRVCCLNGKGKALSCSNAPSGEGITMQSIQHNVALKTAVGELHTCHRPG